MNQSDLVDAGNDLVKEPFVKDFDDALQGLPRLSQGPGKIFLLRPISMI